MQSAINIVTNKKDLSANEMSRAMNLTMSGQATNSQISAFLVGLSMKGETIEEITAAARVMRQLSEKVHVSCDYLVDTCGTGGDSSGSFNISTACCFVAAAAGANVAKHGNRSITSKSGSADVLETAGVNLDLDPRQVAQCIEEIGIGFLFAVNHHNAMKHVMTARKEISIRTIFNILGPLTNPASAPNQVIGVYSEQLLEPLAMTLKNLGSTHVMVVHADDGLDEISIASATNVCELKNGKINTYKIQTTDFGFKTSGLVNIQAKDSKDSLKIIRSVFQNIDSPAKDIVCLNSGAAIYVSGLTESLADGISMADEIISSGKARQKFEDFISYTNELN